MENVCPTHKYPTAYYCQRENQWICEYCISAHKKCGFPDHYTQVLEDIAQTDPSVIINSNIKACESALETIKVVQEKLGNNFQTMVNTLMAYQQSLQSQTNQSTIPKGSLESAIQLTKAQSTHIDEPILKIKADLESTSALINNTTNSILYQFLRSSIESNLINVMDLELIKQWIGAPVILANIFSSQKDGYTGQEFHAKCNNISPTLVVAKTTFGNIIGGYSVNMWESNSGDKYSNDLSLKCFLFSLTLHKKYKLINSTYSTCSNLCNGPTFGGGHDFQILNKCNEVQCNAQGIGHSYEMEDKMAFYGGLPYKIENYEVFKVVII